MKSVGLVGRRGMVGSVLLARMREEGDFALIEPRFFSTTQAGKPAPDVGRGPSTLAAANDIAALAACDILIGTIDAFWEANLELTWVDPPLNVYDDNWPIWTYQEQLPPAKFVLDEPDRRGTAVSSMIASGCVVSGASVRGSLLFCKVVVDERSEVVDSVVLPEVRIGAGCRIRRAVIDKMCVLPPGLRIGQDLGEDRRRFLVTPQGVVLVTSPMLRRIATAS